jgi:alkyl sulfatase BDS1-like metallo-beta-lactamase superfamily hydrolase
MGGVDGAIAKARGYEDESDLRFAIMLLAHAVFRTTPSNHEAMGSLANVLKKLSHQADCGPWRNFSFIGAYELLHGIHAHPVQTMCFDKMMVLELSQLTDKISIRLGGPKTPHEELLIIDWYLTGMKRIST